jgi:hypothetical protein
MIIFLSPHEERAGLSKLSSSMERVRLARPYLRCARDPRAPLPNRGLYR